MLYRTRTYTLRQVIAEEGVQYWIDFKDGAGILHELKVSYDFYMAFRRLELDNRKLENWDDRHREFNEVRDETLNQRARRLPKSVEEMVIEKERAQSLGRAIQALPTIQKRRFLLYHEYDYNFNEIGKREHCTPQAARKSVILAREKIQAQMRKEESI